MRSFVTSLQQDGESRSTALARLGIAAGVSYPTIYWAWRGARVSRSVAEKIERATGGQVRALDLVSGPTRGELIAARKEGRQ